MKTNKSVDCCNEHGMKQSPRYTHTSCAPIIIPKDDRFFSPLRRTCMNYVRSVPAMRNDCTFGPREQVMHCCINNLLLIRIYFNCHNNIQFNDNAHLSVSFYVERLSLDKIDLYQTSYIRYYLKFCLRMLFQ